MSLLVACHGDFVNWAGLYVAITAGVELYGSLLFLRVTHSHHLTFPGTSVSRLLRLDLPVVDAVPSEAAVNPTILRMARNTRSRKR